MVSVESCEISIAMQNANDRSADADVIQFGIWFAAKKNPNDFNI